MRDIFCIKSQLSVVKTYKDKQNNKLINLWNKSKNKLREDFDIVEIMKRLNDFRVLFKYYREKHSDLMIDINSNRRNVVNMEDDNWSTELEKTRGTITKFNSGKSISDNNVNDVSSDS